MLPAAQIYARMIDSVIAYEQSGNERDAKDADDAFNQLVQLKFDNDAIDKLHTQFLQRRGWNQEASAPARYSNPRKAGAEQRSEKSEEAASDLANKSWQAYEAGDRKLASRLSAAAWDAAPQSVIDDWESIPAQGRAAAERARAHYFSRTQERSVQLDEAASEALRARGEQFRDLIDHSGVELAPETGMATGRSSDNDDLDEDTGYVLGGAGSPPDPPNPSGPDHPISDRDLYLEALQLWRTGRTDDARDVAGLVTGNRPRPGELESYLAEALGVDSIFTVAFPMYPDTGSRSRDLNPRLAGFLAAASMHAYFAGDYDGAKGLSNEAWECSDGDQFSGPDVSQMVFTFAAASDLQLVGRYGIPFMESNVLATLRQLQPPMATAALESGTMQAVFHRAGLSATAVTPAPDPQPATPSAPSGLDSDGAEQSQSPTTTETRTPGPPPTPGSDAERTDVRPPSPVPAPGQPSGEPVHVVPAAAVGPDSPSAPPAADQSRTSAESVGPLPPPAAPTPPPTPSATPATSVTPPRLVTIRPVERPPLRTVDTTRPNTPMVQFTRDERRAVQQLVQMHAAPLAPARTGERFDLTTYLAAVRTDGSGTIVHYNADQMEAVLGRFSDMSTPREQRAWVHTATLVMVVRNGEPLEPGMTDPAQFAGGVDVVQRQVDRVRAFSEKSRSTPESEAVRSTPEPEAGRQVPDPARFRRALSLLPD